MPLTEKLDNTRVKRQSPQGFKLTQKHKDNIKKKELSKRVLPLLYDKDKVDYYRNLLNAYNNNFFGYGVFGTLTNYDPATESDKIQSNYDYAKDNAISFMANFASAGALAAANKALRAITITPKAGGNYGEITNFTKNGVLGGGAEAVVIDNTPATVVKFTGIPVEEMAKRNSIANSLKHKYIGYVTDEGRKLPTYIQDKVKILTEETFPKFIGKLDKAMEKNGYKRIQDPNVYGRAYTNGTIVIDDISPGNVGITSGNPWLDKILPDWLKSPKIIDMAYLTVPEWLESGYTFKKGGVLKNRYGSK